MKTRIPAVLIVAAALGAFAWRPLSAGSADQSPFAFRVSTVTGWEDHTIERGATRAEVRIAMGEPSQRLSDDVWLYYRYHSEDLPEAQQQGCNAVLVTFAKDKVVDLKFVNPRAATIVAANLKNQPSGRQVAKE